MSLEEPTESDPDRSAEEAVQEYERLLEEGSAPEPDAFLAARPEVAERIRERIVALGRGHAAIAGFMAGGAAASGANSARAPEPDRAAGRTIGDFRLVREIGRGGMGVVYEAEQVSLRRTVALKVLPGHVTLSPEAVERFRREASTAARLRHSGIVEVYAVGEAEGLHYFAMEFVEGTPLDGVIARMREESPGTLVGEAVGDAVSRAAHRRARPATSDGEAIAARVGEGARSSSERARGSRAPSNAWNRTYIETVCRLAAEVADALEHAHRSGVIHRDVKPSNVLVREDGRAVLTDFGLAREEGLPSMTQTGEFAGTPYYVSPEQAMARRIPVDHRTDVFSLGVTLYELLTLRRPFDGETTQEVLAKIVAKEAASPRKLNPLLPRDLVTIVQKAIEKDPDRRYATAGAFAADLRAFLAYRPIAARPAGAGTRVLKLVRRHRAVSAAAGALLLGGIAAGIWWWRQPGYLTVTSPTAGAVVFVDGEARGTTPLSNLELSPGLHRARLVKGDEDLETIGEEEVLVERGRSKHYDRSLASRNGVIQLESDPPGAQVSLVGEGGLVVEVPRTTPLLVSARAGRYRARFELEGFEPQERVAEVSPAGVQTRCSVVWERGELVFETTQEGLQVEVYRGARAGVGAPLRSLALPLAGPLLLPPDVYSVRAHRMEHDRRDRDNLVLASGGTTRVRLWLAPIERRLDLRLKSNWCPASAVADLDGDGVPEIAASGDAATSFTIFSASGAPLREVDAGGVVRVLAAVDLDGNGLPEFVAGTSTGRLFAVDGEGAGTLDVETGSEGIACLQPVELDGRPPTEVVAETSNGRILAFSADGRPLYSAWARGGSYSNFNWSTRTAGADLMAVDLDGDGREEVVAGTMGGQILALRPDGSTLWSRDVEGWVTALAASDLDGNERPEILVTTQKQRLWPSSGRLLALRASGDPLFDEELPGFSHTVLPTDLDGDGRPEIVVGETGGSILALRASDRSVHFRHEAGDPAMSLLAIDVDGDGRRELLAGLHSEGILALEADGSKRFQVAARARVFDLVACDLDADGRNEVLARVAEDQILAIAPRVDRLFEVRLDEMHGPLVAADLDGDRRTELLTGSSGGRLLASGPGGDSLWERDVRGEVRAIVVRDGEGIGKPEVLVGTQSGAVLAFASDGSPRFDKRANGAVSALVLADLDGDGRAETVASTEGGEVRAFGPDGAERFSTSVGSAVRSPEYRGARIFGAPLAAADLDGDGREEILAGTEKGEILALAGNGASLPGFAAPRLGEPVAFLVAANLDGNGGKELAAATASGLLLALAPDGTTRFTRDTGREVVALLAADLDADRRDEIVIALGSGRILVYGPGGEDRLDRATGNVTYSVLAADTDGDGRRELVASTLGHGISVYALDGTRRFRTNTRHGIFSLILADFDGDGTPEIAGKETGALVGAYRIWRDDPRPAARRAFVAAIEAAGRGDEEAAGRGFANAGLGWLALDDVGLGVLRDRLDRLDGSGPARRMARLLGRVRPPSAREWWEGIAWLAGRGEMGGAAALARAHRVELAKDAQVGLQMNDYAWRMVDPASPRSEGFALALALAEPAAEATGRRPMILDTLAHALDANGRVTDAVKIEEEALAGCAPGDEALRGTLEAALARFRNEAGKAPPAPAPLPRPGAGHSGR